MLEEENESNLLRLASYHVMASLIELVSFMTVVLKSLRKFGWNRVRAPEKITTRQANALIGCDSLDRPQQLELAGG